MRLFFLFLLVGVGCTITPGRVEKQPPGGYYALGVKRKEMSWKDWMNREIHHWLAVYHKEIGHLGYIGCFSKNYYDEEKRLDWYIVVDKTFNPIGCITPKGRTYRFVLTPRYEEVRYVGTYTTNEALEHLFGVAKVTDPDMWYLHAVQPRAKLPLYSPIRYTSIIHMPKPKQAKER